MQFAFVISVVFDRNKNHADLVQLFRAEIPSADDIHKVLELKDLTKINLDKGARLVTYEVDAEMQVTQVRWVSDRIGQWAMETLAHARIKRTMDLLCELSENPATGGAFGIAFEAWAHLKLSEGSSFDARPLIGGGAPCKVVLKPSETKYFDDFKEVNNQVNLATMRPHEYAVAFVHFLSSMFACVSSCQVYGRPNSKTTESIDGIYQPDLIFQMTVSTSKDVNLNDLTTCIAGMRSVASQTFLIAVPEMRYNKFTTVRLSVLPSPASVWPASVTKKLVLCIPIHRSKRKKQDWMEEAEKELKKQHLDPAAVEEFVPMQDEPDLISLATEGMKVMKKRARTWTDIGRFPNVNPKLHIFKQTQGTFVCLQLP